MKTKNVRKKPPTPKIKPLENTKKKKMEKPWEKKIVEKNNFTLEIF